MKTRVRFLAQRGVLIFGMMTAYFLYQNQVAEMWIFGMMTLLAFIIYFLSRNKKHPTDKNGNAMKKHLIILLLACAGITNSNAQNPYSFIPQGYVLFEEYFGDLNKDGEEDCILMIKNTDKDRIVVNRFDEEVDRNRRGIIILFRKGNSYQLAAKNYDCFRSENEDGGVYFPPELALSVSRGNLVVHYAHGRYGHWGYIFRYQDGGFKLIGYDRSDDYGPIIRYQTSINFLTQKKLTRENINENDEGGQEIFKETWEDIDVPELIDLLEINDFYELSIRSQTY